MLRLFTCPICHKYGEMSIKSKFADKEKLNIVFYARCSECGYETMSYDTSNEVIQYLYERTQEQ